MEMKERISLIQKLCVKELYNATSFINGGQHKTIILSRYTLWSSFFLLLKKYVTSIMNQAFISQSYKQKPSTEYITPENDALEFSSSRIPSK